MALQGQASFEDLSDNEVYNILKRLTVKNLCQMSILSSTWKDLINDADFINLHRAWSKKNPLLLVVTQPSHITSNDSEKVDHLLLTSVNPTDGAVAYQVRIETYDDKDLQVLSSRSGCLFCILRWRDSVIFNATTKEIQTLPKVDPPPFFSFVIATGFGYIESRHTYAVIKLFFPIRLCQILMLSETGKVITTWRTLVQNYSRLIFPLNKGVMVRNKYFWLNRDILVAKWYGMSLEKMSMLCLDLESEMFDAIRYPNIGTYEGTKNMHLGDLKDELFLGYSHGDPLVMDIWVLKDLQNSNWNIEYRVDLSLIGGIDDRVLSEVKLIGYVEGEQGGVLMFRDSLQQVLLYYNVEERRFKEGKQIQVENDVLDMFPYRESFSSI